MKVLRALLFGHLLFSCVTASAYTDAISERICNWPSAADAMATEASIAGFKHKISAIEFDITKIKLDWLSSEDAGGSDSPVIRASNCLNLILEEFLSIEIHKRDTQFEVIPIVRDLSLLQKDLVDIIGGPQLFKGINDWSELQEALAAKSISMEPKVALNLMEKLRLDSVNQQEWLWSHVTFPFSAFPREQIFELVDDLNVYLQGQSQYITQDRAYSMLYLLVLNNAVEFAKIGTDGKLASLKSEIEGLEKTLEVIKQAGDESATRELETRIKIAKHNYARLEESGAYGVAAAFSDLEQSLSSLKAGLSKMNATPLKKELSLKRGSPFTGTA